MGTASRPYGASEVFTCNELPGGRYIMTSEMVCRKVWNTVGRGLTASPAIVISDNGWSHIHTSRSCNINKQTIFHRHNTVTLI